MTETIHFDGPCQFLTCLETGPHDHEICPECGTVRYGNPCCNTCCERVNEERGWDLPMLGQDDLEKTDAEGEGK